MTPVAVHPAGPGTGAAPARPPGGMSSVNEPATVQEISALHDAYERALREHDTAALREFFWNSPHTIRYGIAEHLYGAEQIAAFRQGGGPVFANRQLVRREITTFGADAASVMCEFTLSIDGQPRHSRQSQVWVRLAALGWKIVAAHVSHAQAGPDWVGRVQHAAALVGLPVAPAHRAGVAAQLERSAALAAPLLAFPLPGSVEPAFGFEP